ncbi:TPA: hypothetical protein ACPVZG_000620 [Vibrio parahaemolyticus]
MKKVSKNLILAQITKVTGIKYEYIGLEKFGNEYYWCGKAAATFDETNTYLTNLRDVPLERWVQDFQSKVEETLRNSEYNHINDYIESIDWDDI